MVDELSSASIRPEQTTEALGRFDLRIDVKRSIHWHDQLVTETLMISRSVVMNEKRSNSFSRRVLAKENQFVKALGFQRSEKSLQVCVQIWASRWQSNRFHTFASQTCTKRLTERCIAVHDQVFLVLEKAILVVGQLASHRLHPRFVRIGGAAREVDAACFQLHHKEQVERCQSTLGPDFHGGEVDRSHHIPMRFEECFP